jgi:hypothetical protein
LTGTHAIYFPKAGLILWLCCAWIPPSYTIVSKQGEHVPPSSPQIAMLISVFLRNYPEVKLQENLDSEIMEVLLQEARDSYDEEIIVELTSNTSDEMESNVERIEGWVKQWEKDHPKNSSG